MSLATAAAGRSSKAACRPFAGLRTWFTMLAICLEERLVYRGDFIIGTLMRFLPIVTQVFLWTAVFNATSRTDIAGYSRADVIFTLPADSGGVEAGAIVEYYPRED